MSDASFASLIGLRSSIKHVWSTSRRGAASRLIRQRPSDESGRPPAAELAHTRRGQPSDPPAGHGIPQRSRPSSSRPARADAAFPWIRGIAAACCVTPAAASAPRTRGIARGCSPTMDALGDLDAESYGRTTAPSPRLTWEQNSPHHVRCFPVLATENHSWLLTAAKEEFQGPIRFAGV
jgi:hypothetical protein